MFRQENALETNGQSGLLDVLRNSRAVVLGTFASMAIFAYAHGTQEASAMTTGVGYGDVPEQIDDFIEATPKPAPLDGDYDYNNHKLDINNKDQRVFYKYCMYDPEAHVTPRAITVNRLVNSNIINSTVGLAEECKVYTRWQVFATTQYKRGNMNKYVESKTTIPAFTNEDEIVNDAAYGKLYPMNFFPTDVTCEKDRNSKTRVMYKSVRYSLSADKKFVQTTYSKAMSCT